MKELEIKKDAVEGAIQTQVEHDVSLSAKEFTFCN